MVAADLKRKVIAETGCNWKVAKDLAEEAQESLGIKNIDSKNEEQIVNKTADIYRDIRAFRRMPSQQTTQPDEEQDNESKRKAREHGEGRIQEGSLCPSCCVVS